MTRDAASGNFHVRPEISPERKEFYTRLDRKNTTPLWDVLSNLVTPQPQTACVPAFWKYEEIRPLLMEAGRLITAKEAERRVLVLENPGIRGVSQVTQSLYAGVQLVMPGEVAPSHRHAASALRFVLEAGSAYTKVDGARTTMHAGDFVLTPSWAFHDHGNPGNAPAIWLDGLDVPIVNLFDSSFAEHYPEETQPVTKAEASVPIFNYTYARSREALVHFSRFSPVHPAHGTKMQYQNPTTGNSPIPTIGAFLQMLPAGFRGTAYRGTDASVYCVSEGHGRSRVGNSVFEWGVHDIFVVPSWCFVSHEADTDAVLFSFSDRPAQKAFGLWREEFQSA
jgi:gentisate 1,2-dioxygenase